MQRSSMPPVRTLSLIAVLAILVVVALIAYNVGLNHPVRLERERTQIDWNGSRAQTKDAIQRWMRKTGPREMDGRYAVVMSFPDRNCVELKLEPGSVGGEPIYCYRANTLQLIEEHSDVE